MDSIQAALILGLSVACLLSLIPLIRRSFRHRKRLKRAYDRERDAETVLRAAGYRIQERQVTARLPLIVDGEPVDYGLRADLLVQKGRKTFIAEVKTGNLAPDLGHAPTRRQLLEYRIGFPQVRGVLLVDMESEEVHEIRFPALDPPRVWRRIALATLLGAAAGAAIMQGFNPC